MKLTIERENDPAMFKELKLNQEEIDKIIQYDFSQALCSSLEDIVKPKVRHRGRTQIIHLELTLLTEDTLEEIKSSLFNLAANNPNIKNELQNIYYKLISKI